MCFLAFEDSHINVVFGRIFIHDIFCLIFSGFFLIGSNEDVLACFQSLRIRAGVKESDRQIRQLDEQIKQSEQEIQKMEEAKE